MNSGDMLSQAFLERQPAAAAALLQKYPSQEASSFLADLPLPLITQALSNMAYWPAAKILSQFTPLLSARVLTELVPTRGELLLRLLTEFERNRILQQMPARQARAFSHKLIYPLATVGAWMDATIPLFPGNTSISDCLDMIKNHQGHLGGIIIVVNDQRQLVGVTEVDRLLASEADKPLTSLADPDITPLSSRATLWEVGNHDQWSRYPTLPVADPHHVIVGALTHSALIEGTHKSVLFKTPPARFSLIAHMCQAFFIALTDLIKVVGGFSYHPASKSPAQDADKNY